MGKTVNELHAMLKLHEQNLNLPKSSAPALHAIQAGKVQKSNKHKKSHSQKGAKGKNQGKGKFAPKPKVPPPPKRENPAKDSICHECEEIRRWKRNCPQYLAELIKKKKNTASGAGGLAVEAIGAFYLCLPSGLEIVLNNCHYAPSITRGVISVSCLYEDGFVNRFVDNTIQVSRNNVVYFCAIPRDGIFEIDLSNSLTNESSVYAVSNKRAKLNLDSAILSFFEKQKLTGPNFIDWYRQLRIVLSIEDKLNYLEQPIPPTPVAPAGQQVAPEILIAHASWVKGSKEIAGLMLMTMEPEIQRNLEPLHAHEMLKELKTLFAQQAEQELLQTTRDFHSCSNAPALHAIQAGKVQKGNKYKKSHSQKGAKDRTLEEELSSVSSRVNEEEEEHSFGSWWFRDGIFEIDLSNSLTNESFVYAVSNKRAKLDLDSALLWHCRLGHISKKRIEKLQDEGLLNSSDLTAFEKCVSCILGKMARKPYTHQVERAKDLLGLIHTDVCGPFKIMSRQGASYFVTFTDDFSRYGYVYLLKHKHEVFETFKVFQKEVKNQLEKTIKSLRFDRGGEYMSQEFLDHLKDHGIIA
nr:retrotransposon protein, putative, Ty1-copia subclass [Tanacetum cinerariifolium]